MKDVGIIGSADGPTAIFVSKSDNEEAFWKSGGIIEENDEVTELNKDEVVEEVTIDTSIEDKLNSKTLGENFDAGFKIMGLGMVAVFGVLTMLYIVIKIMGQFAKQKDDKDSSNEKN